MDGHRGEFPFFFHVYRKEVCPEGHRVIREETADKRTTHWVPEVQG
jgi:formamidopyrimidine-DNA glycosylase